MIGRDGVTGLVACATSLVLFWLTLGLEKNPLVPIGPGFYPRLVLGLTALLGFALLVADVLRRRASRGAARAVPAERLNYLLVALTFAVFGAYVLLLPLLGYRVATFLFVLGCSFLLEPPRSAGLWLRGPLLALATTLATYFIFEDYLAVLLPRGSWTGF
jgi:putative tricarboxylic transport membrane protein